MVTAKNPITGDTIATKPTSASYRDNFDAIFRKKEEPCDMGEMCLDCQPRGENSECPDKASAEPVCKGCYGIGYDSSGYACVCTRSKA